jgi:uncharacterized heparinase superfamily protein
MLTELTAETDRFRAGRRGRAFDGGALRDLMQCDSMSDVWSRLSGRLYAVPIPVMTEREYDRACPGDARRIIAAAEQALARRVDLLGTGPVDIGTPIDWHRDFKTGKTWPVTFMRSINYTNLGCPSDVKVPWELSRLQWLIPVGQAYALTGDERYADGAKAVLDDWISSNPYAHGVNWACTMEVAIRILTWTWFFHVFCRSRSWSADERFQETFLGALYLHGDFTERYIERSDVNGNHFTADAVGLVFAGLFFGDGAVPQRWAHQGWAMLEHELPRQVFPDGVDFEASVAYHRLVAELFFLAARYREACGQPVADAYRDRVIDMARFTLAYSRPDGSTPLVGDADDARTIPFGPQSITDHRYVLGLIGAHWHVADLINGFSGPRAEVLWTLGRRAAASLPDETQSRARVPSAVFPDGGFYVMRNDRDHIFIDCGPVGLAGRGGHGHNDCLSFEAMLDGVHLVSDCGAYLYTASAEERNRFRSTAAHNTPQVDGGELNRFVRWDHLWSLHDDARPDVRQWHTGADRDVFVGSHSGYRRLDGSVSPLRTITLDHAAHTLVVRDVIEGAGEHIVAIPLHLAAGVTARVEGPGEVVLQSGGREFALLWSSLDTWRLEIEAARISPSYGVAVPCVRLLWHRAATLPASLTISLAPRAISSAPRAAMRTGIALDASATVSV